MRTLMSERFAPITSSLGFVKAPLDAVAAEAANWTAGLQPNTRATEVRGSLPELLTRLGPLVTSIRPRMLYVGAGGGAWTAYFDCLSSGSDPVGPVDVLAQRLGCDGVRVTTVPDEYGPDAAGRYGRQGAVSFTLVRAARPADKAAATVRSVSVMRENERFLFEEHGEAQPFEQTERYASRRIRDRLTSEMVEAYCRALGLEPFEAASYGPRAVLVDCEARWDAKGGHGYFPLAEVQARRGIVPGAADTARG